MQLAEQIISIDIGTTHLKMTLFHQRQIVETSSWRYQQVYVSGAQHQLDALEIQQIIIDGLRHLVATHHCHQLDIVLTSAMHTVQLLTADFRPEGPLYTWADRTGSIYVDRRHEDFLADYQRTGTPIHAMNPYFKLHSLLNDAEQVRVGSIKDFLVYQFTGCWYLDESCASSSGLFDTAHGCWDEMILARLDLRTTDLPQVFPGRTRVPLSQVWCEQLGLTSGGVYLGYSDGVSSNGAFLNVPDAAVLSVGTSHAIRVISPHFCTDTTRMNFAYRIDAERYIIGFPSNNGGNVLEWLIKTFHSSFAELDDIVAQAPTARTLFFPYLYGERAPLWNANAQASLTAFDVGTTREELLFSIVLGLFFNMRYNMESLAALQDFDKVALTGGLLQSQPLCRLLANVLGKPLYISQERNLETFGALQLLTGEPLHIAYDVITPSHNDYDSLYAAFKEHVNTASRT